jgi:phosphonate degradation associated HDIG domain protein
MQHRVDCLLALMARAGARQYGGEAVSQREHALQCAALAEAERAAPSLVAAALLHDIGHLLAPPLAPRSEEEGEMEGGPEATRHGIDDRHEIVGAAALAEVFGPAVAEPVRLHVAAKRWLCAVEPGYFALLSQASVTSLGLQGGPFSAAEAAQFAALPFADDAIRLRRWDEAAKLTGRTTPPLDHYRALLGGLCRP